MALPAGTYTSYPERGVSNVEDVEDILYNISPTETPFLTMLEKKKAKNTAHEWLIEELAPASGSNAAIEGDDAVGVTATPATRVLNRTQISQKTVIVSDTQQAIEHYGKGEEMAHQVMLSGTALKRDMETILLQNQASTDGVLTSAARKLGSILAMYTTNTSIGSGGTDGGFVSPNWAVRTDGTQRALTESLVKAVIQRAWTEGGAPDLLMAGPFNKTVISGWASTNSTAGTATAARSFNIEQTARRLITTIDYFESDFGVHKIIANRFQRERDLHVLDTSMWAIAYLRPFQVGDLAKTGDSTKKQLKVEYTLVGKNQKSSGLVADLTTS